jgi:hypothetical protein
VTEPTLDPQAEALAAWIASIISHHGGVMTSANLGSTLSSEHADLYRVIKVCWIVSILADQNMHCCGLMNIIISRRSMVDSALC